MVRDDKLDRAEQRRAWHFDVLLSWNSEDVFRTAVLGAFDKEFGSP